MKAPFEAIGRGVKTSNSSLLPASLNKRRWSEELEGEFRLKGRVLSANP